MAIRFPSVANIASGLRRAGTRFPVALFFFAAGAACGHVWVQVRGDHGDWLWRALVLAPTLGLLGFAARLRLESRGIHRRVEALAGIGVLAVGAAVFFAAPSFQSPQGLVFFALWVVFVLCVLSLAPFSRSREFRGFWRHGQAVVERGLLAAIFAAAIYGGLALALVALEGLFGVRVPSRVYGHLAVFLFLLGLPTFGLATYPEPVRALDSETDFPGALRSFAQWVMVPLVTVYGVILLVYALQILVRWEWPKGTVGWLVSWAGTLGLATNLVLLPLFDRHELRWLRAFFRAFYAALAVFATLLLMATYRRVSEYGWTEERVLLAALGAWFLLLAIYFTVRPKATRQWIPASLGLLAIAFAAGPVSAHRIAMRDQTKRLAALVARLGIQPTGPLKRRLDSKDRRQLWDQLDYFRARHELVAVAGRLFPPVKTTAESHVVGAFLEAIGQPTEYPYEDGRPKRFFVRTKGRIFPIEKFTRLAALDYQVLNLYSNTREEIVVDGRKLFFASDRKVLRVEDVDRHVVLRFDLAKWRASMEGSLTEEQVLLPPEACILEGESRNGWKGRLFVQSATIQNGPEGIELGAALLAFRLPGE